MSKIIPKQPQEMKWRTKDGRDIAIKDMTDNHILNACRFMENKIVDIQDMLHYADHPIWGPRGDGAQMAFESELSAKEEGVEDVYAWIHIFSVEIESRGLKKLAPKKPLKMPEGELIEDTGQGQIWRLK